MKKNNSVCIYISLGLFLTMFLSLIIYICSFYATNKEQLINNTYNKHEKTLLTQNLRGDIYSADGVLLAYSVQNDDGSQTRIYPYGSMFAHSVGYSSKGKAGIELEANYYLANSDQLALQKAGNYNSSQLNKGNSVNSTLDFKLTQIADEYLGNYKGAVIVTNVKTGEILTLVSHPGFDPNNIDQIWDSLINDANNSSLLNRATSGKYPPGSTFKIVSALEYYRENGEKKCEKYVFDCPGYFNDGVNSIKCFHGTVHGNVDLRLSFAKSCNSSFANIGMSLNKKKFSKTLDDLMFNQNIDIGIPTIKSTIYVSKDTSDYDMMQTSIGQGTTSISPIHLNMITMAIANNGVLMKPYMVSSAQNTLGMPLYTNKPKQYTKLISSSESEYLTSLMMDVVEEGTATKLKSNIYTAAGKTGSAEYNNRGDSHAWFTGFAPADDPEIAVTIIIEAGGTGGERAVPLAKLLFDDYFEREN